MNPTNGHAHYLYLLRGWVRVVGADAGDLAAVRYFVAIERAYTRALRADAGYPGLVQHNLFRARYETFIGRDEPYSLRELAAHVELPALTPGRKAEIRTDGRQRRFLCIAPKHRLLLAPRRRRISMPSSISLRR